MKDTHQANNIKDKDNKEIMFYSAITIFISFILFVVALSFIFDGSAREIYQLFLSSFFHCSENYCFFDKIHHKDPLTLIYFFFFLMLVSISGLFPFIKHSAFPRSRIRLKLLSICTITLLLLIAGFQQTSRNDALLKLLSSIYQPNSVFIKIKDFCTNAKKSVPSHHQADVITDQDLSIDPFMLFQRTISYQLYPEISLRFNNNRPRDCLFFFFAADIQQDLPGNYQILHLDKTGNYAIAIQKDSLQNASR